MADHPLGCYCKDCMLKAYDDVFNDPDADPELKGLIAEIVLEDYPLYVVDEE